MALDFIVQTRRTTITRAEEERLRKKMAGLEERLVHFPEPIARVTIERHEEQRRTTVDLRVQLGPHAGHLISHQAAETLDLAARLATEDVERQLERRLAVQRGEPTFGVPSRRLPAHLRPSSSEGIEEGEI